jgi:hypothetical protein
MALTPAQLQTLKTTIDADPALSAFPNNSDGAFQIAALLNVPAVPAFFVFRTSVPVTEIMQNGFDWTRVDNLTVGKARIWEFMTIAQLLNPSQANVRSGILAVFGTAGDLQMRQAIFNHCQRTASRAEKVFATGAGTTVSEQGVGPAVLSFEGQLSFQDVQDARNS